MTTEKNINPETKKEEISPSDYFDRVKARKNEVTDESLKAYYENLCILVEKAHRLGQKEMTKRLLFHIDCVEKERELINKCVTTFVYRDDITSYIEDVAKKTVKIIKLEDYPREIPDDIAEIVEEVGGIFDELYVVFTDYTGKIEKTVEKKRREKDPILFGAFRKGNILNDRFYFLGDWVDEYCDLTLAKMVNEMQKAGKGNIKQKVVTPTDIETIREQVNGIKKVAGKNNDGTAYTEYVFTRSETNTVPTK